MKKIIVLLAFSLLLVSPGRLSVVINGHPSKTEKSNKPNRSEKLTHLADDGYAKDNWKVFYKGKELKDASASSFKPLKNGYAKDNWRVFYKGKLVKDASASSFENLKDGYAKDNWGVFYKGKLVKDASASSFKVLSDGYAKDNWRMFYKGKEAK